MTKTLADEFNELCNAVDVAEQAYFDADEQGDDINQKLGELENAQTELADFVRIPMERAIITAALAAVMSEEREA